MAKLTLADYGSLQNESTVVAQLNSNNTLIENALENTLSRDGTLPNQMNDELDMNSNRIINLPDAISNTEPVTYEQFNDALEILEQGASVTASYVTLGASSGLTSERVLTGSPSISIVDGGANSTVTVNAVASGIDNQPGTLSGKTINLTDNTLTGTRAQFNTALSDDNFATLTGGETLTNKTLTSAQLNACAAGAGANGLYLSGASSGFVLLNSPAASSGTITVPNGTDTLVARATADTLTNKTLITPTVSNQQVDTVRFNGSTSGTTNLVGSAVGVSGVLTLPSATGTVLSDNNSATLSNKTYNTATTGNLFLINSAPITGYSGTGQVVALQTSPSLVTPSLGVATATSINGSVLSPGHQSGEVSNGNAVAGEVGEYVVATLAAGSAISLTSTVPGNVHSISLTAGDWDVTGFVGFAGGATTQAPYLEGSISTTSATPDYTIGRWANWQAGFAGPTPFNFGSTGASEVGVTLPTTRISIASPATVYLVAKAQFTVSTAVAFGIIRARRMR